MANGNGRSDAPDDRDELPPGLSAWFAIEECVGETLHDLLDQERFRAVDQQEAGNAAGGEVAEEGARLQTRILRRPD